MTYDVLYSLKGDQFVGRVFKTVRSEAEAFKAAKQMAKKFPVMNAAITCEDGRTIVDTQKDGVEWLF